MTFNFITFSMDIQMYFEPIDVSQLNGKDDYLPTSMGEVITPFFLEKGFPLPRYFELKIPKHESVRRMYEREREGETKNVIGHSISTFL